MILVTGATGHLGSAIVQQLKKHLSHKEFIVTSSNETGLKQLEEQGLQARLADFSNPETLKLAFQGITQIALVSTMDSNRLEQHKNVIDAAKGEGVKHIVYTSLAIKDINSSGVYDLMVSHFQTEDYLKESGVGYTILRNTMYADALTQILGQEGLKKNINLPGGDGKVPYVLRREMGEATANLLLKDKKENKIYNITNSQSYSYQDIANELTDITGNKIEYKDISNEKFVEGLKQIGFPEFAIYLHAGTVLDIKNHQYEIVEHTLEDLLGRPPSSAREFLKEIFELN